jgi:hypothetical protein
MFLRRVMGFELRHLLPDPADDFFRPVSRDLYFGVVALGGAKPFVAHSLSLLALLGTVALLVRVTSQLAGMRAGILAGLLFAGLGQVPVLVSWASGSQDLLAAFFILLAITFRIDGRNRLALAAASAAVLSKETALVLFPTLVLFDWIAGRKAHRIQHAAIAYGAIALLWALIHPGLRHLLESGFRRGTTGYLGMASEGSIPSNLLKSLLTLVNVPVAKARWPDEHQVIFVLAALVAIVGVWLAYRGGGRLASEKPLAPIRLAMVSLLLLIPPLLLAATLARNWFPYYAVMGGLGSAILFGTLLARAPISASMAAALVFLTLGVWSRGMELPSHSVCERNLGVASATMARIESGFKTLRPSLPPRSQVLLSVQTGGTGGAYGQMFQLQPLQVWYRDRSIRTVHATQRIQTGGPEFLFAVTPRLDVVEFDPASYGARSSGRPPDYIYGETANRLYALGVFGSGEPDRAVYHLLGMPEVDTKLAGVHRRLAAAMLLASGRAQLAESLLTSLPDLPRDYRLQSACGCLAETLKVAFEPAVLRAFGVSESDGDALQELLACFEGRRAWKPAWGMARRLQKLRPGDRGLARKIDELEHRIESEEGAPRWGMLAGRLGG